MKFLDFLRRNNTELDSALHKCNQSFETFKEQAHKGHFQNFKDFKIKFLQESHYLRKEIVDCKDNNLKNLLITHLQNQLDYFNDNPYGPYAAKVDIDRFNAFIAENYPYKEKVNKIKTEYFLNFNKDEKFLKHGFSKLLDILESEKYTPNLFNNNNTNYKPGMK